MRLNKTAIMWGISLVAGAALLAVLWPRTATNDAERRAVAEGRTIVVYWDRHWGHEHRSRVDLIEEFNESQNEVYVRALPIGYNSAMEKILTATAGGAPPDICSLDTPLVAQLAPQGLLEPLDDFMEGIEYLREDRFFPHTWGMSHFDGHTWGVPTSTDVYCLVWNKAAFRNAGLDPERPPATIEELLDYAAKLTVRAPDGSVSQMGLVPWVPWDHTSLWGSVFGVNWYDEATGTVNLADDAALIDSLRFQASFVNVPGEPEQPWGVSKANIQAFYKGLGEYQSANNPFYSGKVAMITEGEWQVTFIAKYAPNMDWGVAPLPMVPGIGQIGYGPYCVSDCIPATAKNKEAAKKFLRWFYSPRPDGRPSPASDYCHAIHNIPPRIDEAAQERFTGHPKFKVFVDQLSQPVVASLPVNPVMQYMLDQLERQRERVVFREVTPEQAAREIEKSVNAALERARVLIGSKSK